MMRWYDTRIWKWVLVMAVVLLAAFTLAGCKSKEYVMVPEYHTEYICRTDTVAKMDSVYVKDSVYVYRNGDTVMITKTAYRDRWRNVYKVRLDTIFKRDSVNVPYPVVKELSKNEQRLMALGRSFIVIVLVVLVVGISFLFYHNKKC